MRCEGGWVVNNEWWGVGLVECRGVHAVNALNAGNG